jgi:PBP1b-binding outer membrane lipoprotein LpoB
MKYIIALVIMLIATLSGCSNDPNAPKGTYKDVTSSYVLPLELKDCKVYRLDTFEEVTLWETYCPDKTTLNDTLKNGKMTVPVTVIKDATTTYPLGSTDAKTATISVDYSELGKTVALFSKDPLEVQEAICLPNDKCTVTIGYKKKD